MKADKTGSSNGSNGSNGSSDAHQSAGDAKSNVAVTTTAGDSAANGHAADHAADVSSSPSSRPTRSPSTENCDPRAITGTTLRENVGSPANANANGHPNGHSRSRNSSGEDSATSAGNGVAKSESANGGSSDKEKLTVSTGGAGAGECNGCACETGAALKSAGNCCEGGGSGHRSAPDSITWGRDCPLPKSRYDSISTYISGEKDFKVWPCLACVALR